MRQVLSMAQSIPGLFVIFIATVSLLAWYHFLNPEELQYGTRLATPPLKMPKQDKDLKWMPNSGSSSQSPLFYFVKSASSQLHPGGNDSTGETTVSCTSNYRKSQLPSSVIENAKTFVFFVGHGRSGSSIIGSMLDSHPHMIIAYQSHILQDILKNPEVPTKSFIFNKIWKTSCYMTVTTGRKETYKDSKKNYTLFFDGLYQGKYSNYIDVIGDKEAGKISGIFMKDPDQFQTMLSKLQAAVNIPIKVIHPIRNPFDNIATFLLYKLNRHNDTATTKTKLGNQTVAIDLKKIDDDIEDYFHRYQAAEEATKMFNLDTIKIHNKDLVMHPRKTIVT
ncbi:uncharacterized protein [Dysidea avara]|uniref:uncharacterized protein n=1 Tax=Dysidea avara TaxID=196820 RepID=UPI00331A7F8D